jgi:hypothetical protein
MFGLILLLPLYLGITTGKWSDSGKMAGSIIVLAAIVLGSIALVRVEVDEDEIRLRKYGVIHRRVRFDTIGHTYTSALAEKDWPVSLTIVGQDGRKELMSIKLKVFGKEDVAWLLALPKLKVRR